MQFNPAPAKHTQDRRYAAMQYISWITPCLCLCVCEPCATHALPRLQQCSKSPASFSPASHFIRWTLKSVSDLRCCFFWGISNLRRRFAYTVHFIILTGLTLSRLHCIDLFIDLQPIHKMINLLHAPSPSPSFSSFYCQPRDHCSAGRPTIRHVLHLHPHAE